MSDGGQGYLGEEGGYWGYEVFPLRYGLGSKKAGGGRLWGISSDISIQPGEI